LEEALHLVAEISAHAHAQVRCLAFDDGAGLERSRAARGFGSAGREEDPAIKHDHILLLLGNGGCRHTGRPQGPPRRSHRHSPWSGYSITSSTRARNVGGMASFNAVAVRWLRAKCEFAGSSKGQSPGLVPRNILSRVVAMRCMRSS